MPLKSLSQARLMYAAANGYTNKVPKKVADEYISATPKNRFKRLKEKVKRKNEHK